MHITFILYMHVNYINNVNNNMPLYPFNLGTKLMHYSNAELFLLTKFEFQYQTDITSHPRI